ncbi:YfhO family protein [Dactylosporangium sp. AC04546]|uniref:YfhO family protein n=1 Tax=Dactylosporangium sp. AC04546 TaxID=2862460 RepID=UPI001EE04295|nr:YfhO family protein [Dactylosporangium sp. AC04546]WVK89152.1 YfhO family protein [Dactylosporangium sp. AC04546]
MPSRSLSVAGVAAVVLFALWGLAGPLTGRTVLAPTDEMIAGSPYAAAGAPGERVDNAWLDDVYTAQLPSAMLFKHALDRGDIAGWNPYEAGGTPLAAVPNNALFSPLSLPYYLMPTWLAPAYEELLEIVCAVGGGFLLLRRWQLSRPAALGGGLMFATSAFMLIWLDFPQTQVAAFIPATFWTVERFLQLRRARDAALVAVPVAAMLLGGFPAVTGYTLLTVGGYALARVVAQRSAGIRSAAASVAGIAGGVLAGFGLAAFQLLPFIGFYRSWYIEGRAQTPGQHLDPAALVTTVAPFALGTADPNRQPFLLGTNVVESLCYTGAATLVLAVAAIGLTRAGRAGLPRGVWVFLVAGVLLWGVLIFAGGPLLAIAQHTPGIGGLFAGNFIGRARSIFGFMLAALGAVGFELLLTSRSPAARPGRWWLTPAAVWLLVAAGAGAVVWRGRQVAAANAAVDGYDRAVLTGAVLVGCAVVCAVVARRARPGSGRWRRMAAPVAAGALLLQIGGQAGWLVHQYWPHSSRATFYPVTDTHQYLADGLGHERFAAAGDALIMGTGAAYRLRSLNGHAFLDRSFAELLGAAPGTAVPWPTYVTFDADVAQATSTILDRLGVRYFVTAPSATIFGSPAAQPLADNTMTLEPDSPVTVAATLSGGIRGIGVVPADTSPAGPGARLRITVRDGAGVTVADTSYPVPELTAGQPWVLPVAEFELSGPAAVTLTLSGPAAVGVMTDAGSVTIPTVAADDDGLRLAYAGSTVIYERRHALERIRWAGSAVVERSADRRLEMLAAGAVDAHTVLLSGPAGASGGGNAGLRVEADDNDVIQVAVSAETSGYLVVADADQTGWTAAVDGRRVPLLPADHGVVAVAVPAGDHLVSLTFSAPHGRLGGWLTAATAALLVVVSIGGTIGVPLRRRRSVAPVPHTVRSDSA